MDVERRPKSGIGLGHYLPKEIQGLGQTPGKGELERGRRGLTIPGLGEVGGKKTVDDDGVNFSISRMGQAVATFDSGQEALGHEEALLFKGGRKHHIVPQRELPARLACGRQVTGAGDARRPETADRGITSTNAKDRNSA
jgi:hypothetical protein